MDDQKFERGELKPLNQYISGSTVRVEVPVVQRGNVLVPCLESDQLLVAKLRCMKTGEYFLAERECTEILVDKKNRVEVRTDYITMRGLILRRSLLLWNLNVPLSFDEQTGWLSDECWSRVEKLPAPLMSAIISKYERSFTIDSDESRVINRQSLVLFGKHNRGVANPCEAVSMFCNLSSFWKQFGIDRKSLNELPYLDYLRLRVMTANENEAMSRQLKASDSSVPKARVVGRGGRARPSRGVVVQENY